MRRRERIGLRMRASVGDGRRRRATLSALVPAARHPRLAARHRAAPRAMRPAPAAARRRARSAASVTSAVDLRQLVRATRRVLAPCRAPTRAPARCRCRQATHATIAWYESSSSTRTPASCRPPSQRCSTRRYAQPFGNAMSESPATSCGPHDRRGGLGDEITSRRSREQRMCREDRGARRLGDEGGVDCRSATAAVSASLVPVFSSMRTSGQAAMVRGEHRRQPARRRAFERAEPQQRRRRPSATALRA